MSDIFDRVTEQQDFFKKIVSKIPGFQGYIDRVHRRDADKILREGIADLFQKHWERISQLQRDIIAAGKIDLVDDLESSAVKLRQFIDRIRTASYGYAGFFDALKINSEELTRVYQYDLELLSLSDDVSLAIDNVEASLESDGLPAALRNLRTQSQACVEAYEQRDKVMRNVAAEPPVSE